MANTERVRKIGEAIKARREAMGLGRDEVAWRAGVARNTMWCVEEGKYGFNISTLHEILDALDGQLVIEWEDLDAPAA